MTRVKFCGLKREEDIFFANETMPDYIGFVFAEKSKRYVSFEKARRLKKLLLPEISVVGVFVNENVENVAALINNGVIDMAQLHGDEDREYIKRLQGLTGSPVIKAFRIKSEADVEIARKSEADMVLLDSSCAGSGRCFDWSLIKNFDRNYFLAGGLSCENIAKVMQKISPFAVDTSSGIETDGVKDIKKMYGFISAVRKGC